jgi:hypothetical protein
MKLPDLTSLSCVFLGTDGVPTGVKMALERFTGLGVTTSFFPKRGDLGAGERCLLSVPVRWTGRRTELLALALGVGLVGLLGRIFGPASTGFVFNFDGRGALTSGICINDTQMRYWCRSTAVHISTT